MVLVDHLLSSGGFLCHRVVALSNFSKEHTAYIFRVSECSLGGC
jgi:hypothetical protein